MACAASWSAGSGRNAPPNAPTAVRKADTTAARRILSTSTWNDGTLA
jgi:hypothetical protein